MSKYKQEREEQAKELAALAEEGHGAPMIRVLEATSPGICGAHCLQTADWTHYVSFFNGGALLAATEIVRWEALAAVRADLLDELSAAVGTDDLSRVVGKMLQSAEDLGYWKPAGSAQGVDGGASL